MTNECKNCGQPALATDTICWHCGQALSPQKKQQQQSAAATESVPQVPPLPLPKIAAYGGLTLFIIIALLWVMQALGQQPQVIQSLGDSLKPGWTAVNDYNKTITLNLPAQWQILDRFAPEQEALFTDTLRQSTQYQTPLAAYDAAAADRQLLLIAQASPDEQETAVPAFILVTHSQQISQLTPKEMTELLNAGPSRLELLRTNLETSLNGREQVTYLTAQPYKEQTLRCQHLFYKSANSSAPDSYLIIGCVSQDSYSFYTNIFHDILLSFQPLLR